MLPRYRYRSIYQPLSINNERGYKPVVQVLARFFNRVFNPSNSLNSPSPRLLPRSISVSIDKCRRNAPRNTRPRLPTARVIHVRVISTDRMIDTSKYLYPYLFRIPRNEPEEIGYVRERFYRSRWRKYYSLEWEKIEWRMIVTRITNGLLIKRKKFKIYMQFYDRFFLSGWNKELWRDANDWEHVNLNFIWRYRIKNDFTKSCLLREAIITDYWPLFVSNTVLINPLIENFLFQSCWPWSTSFVRQIKFQRYKATINLDKLDRVELADDVKFKLFVKILITLNLYREKKST